MFMIAHSESIFCSIKAWESKQTLVAVTAKYEDIDAVEYFPVVLSAWNKLQFSWKKKNAFAMSLFRHGIPQP